MYYTKELLSSSKNNSGRRITFTDVFNLKGSVIFLATTKLVFLLLLSLLLFCLRTSKCSVFRSFLNLAQGEGESQNSWHSLVVVCASCEKQTYVDKFGHKANTSSHCQISSNKVSFQWRHQPNFRFARFEMHETFLLMFTELPDAKNIIGANRYSFGQSAASGYTGILFVR